MKLRSSKIIGIPNNSLNISHIPCYSNRSIHSIIFMNIICISGLYITIFFLVLYSVFQFYEPLQNEITEPPIKFDWSDILTA